MKKLALVSRVSFFLFVSLAQNREIMYQFPDDVMEHVAHYLESETQEGEYFYGNISSIADAVELLVSTVSITSEADTSPFYQLTRSSNRFLQINSQKLPIISMKDRLFSQWTNRKMDDNTYELLSVGGSGGLFIRFVGRPWTSNSILEVEY